MKKISIIKKAQELGLCKISKHPFTRDRIILPPELDPGEMDLTDKWNELQEFANNRRNVKVVLKPQFKE